MATTLANRRIPVVEDEMMITLVVEEVLKELGCLIVGPANKLEAALRLARQEEIDAAILDITIRGGQVFPVAEVLIERGVPFILASGYGDWSLPQAFQGKPRLQKPFTSDELQSALEAIAAPS
ncbi:response regulator [Labrys miyagiensis]|uniref:Response regulator n=1 Tax=Labrys miyagiensis TaxID=346912 RepID=A0ABQ6CPZ6_9HYPH|nr:response regulator [Labrys miyagiensis]GLS20980.1 response regulator [Labrys miyagiensis]